MALFIPRSEAANYRQRATRRTVRHTGWLVSGSGWLADMERRECAFGSTVVGNDKQIGRKGWNQGNARVLKCLSKWLVGEDRLLAGGRGRRIDRN